MSKPIKKGDSPASWLLVYQVNHPGGDWNTGKGEHPNVLRSIFLSIGDWKDGSFYSQDKPCFFCVA